MENYYCVGIDNRYALFLDDESDPLDAITAREQAKELKKKAKEAEKETKGQPETKLTGINVVTRKGITGKLQNPIGTPRSNDRNVERPPPRGHEERPQNGTVAECKEGARPLRRKFGDRRPYFGDKPKCPGETRDDQRGPRLGYDGHGKREFDRRMRYEKTVAKSVDKREGAGSHNKNELDELNNARSVGKVGEKKPADTAGTGGARQAKPERTPPVVEKLRELTLDEYKAQRNAYRIKPKYNLRMAGEGEDLSKWKNMVALEKKKDSWEDNDSDEEYDIAAYPQRVGRQKHVHGIEFTFNDSSRRGSAGRNRGFGRGWRGRGGQGAVRKEVPPVDERPVPRSHVTPPKVDDNKDFPSLG